MRKTVCALLVCFVFSLPLYANPQGGALRSFDDLFPGLSREDRDRVFSEEGLIHSHRKNRPLTISPAPASGIELHRIIMSKDPPYLTESVLVIPHLHRPYSNLDAYNALGRIQDLQGRLYDSYTRGQPTPLFEEATRITSDRRNTLPDPSPASVLPSSETVYVRLRDVNFGNSFYRADFSTGPHGVTYSLTNSRNLSYAFFTVMREGRFNAMLYIEPISEGMLIYSVAGADASDFIAGRIDIPSAISKRLEVFIGWVSDVLRGI